MSEYEQTRGTWMLPQVAVATSAVVLVPVALVWWLRAARIVTSSWLCVVLAVVLSVAVSGLGSALWKRREGSERVLFSELLLWGWIRRMRQERQLANVVAMLGLDGRDELPAQRQGELLVALATALDAQDPYTEGHSRRVARHAAMVARELHLSDDQVQRIRAAAAVHDVGKLRIPAALLSKPGRLTEDEFEIVKRHATEGAALVAGLGDEELAAIVRHHHERFDGHGYPSSLAGVDIPLGARIVAVADTFDAITSIRPYRPAERHKQALDHLAAAAGTQLDPAAVRAFVRYYSGRKLSMLWAGLAVVPQRLFGWMRGSRGATGNVAFGEVAATIGGVVAVGLAAMGTAAAVGVGSTTSRTVIARRAPTAATRPRPVARRSVPASRRGVVAGTAVHHAAARGTYVALKTARATPPAHGGGSSASAKGVRTGSVRGGGSPGGSVNARPPGVPGANPHRVKVGGSSSGPRPKHAGGSRPAPPAPIVVAPVAPGPVVTSPGSGAAPSSPVNAAPASPAGAAPTTPSPPGPGVPGAPTGAPSAPPSGPTNKDQCKGGGYQQWGFKNQGQCVASVAGH